MKYINHHSLRNFKMNVRVYMCVNTGKDKSCVFVKRNLILKSCMCVAFQAAERHAALATVRRYRVMRQRDPVYCRKSFPVLSSMK